MIGLKQQTGVLSSCFACSFESNYDRIETKALDEIGYDAQWFESNYDRIETMYLQ